MEIFNSDGQVSEYVTVAERISQFLEKYGPQNGCAIRSSVQTFGETGFAFWASLEDPEGRTVAEASALRRIGLSSDEAVQSRVWECGETAALQRLMARVGFGSEQMLADDEQRDMDAKGTAYQVATDASEPSSETTESEADGVSESRLDHQAQAVPSSQGSGSSEVADALLRQIRHLAALRGIEPPNVTTKDQAKKALKELRATPAE